MRNRFYLPTRKTYKFKNYTRHFCFFIKLLYQDAINNHPLDSSRSIIFLNVSRTRRIIPPKLLARIYTHTHIIYNIHNTHIYIYPFPFPADKQASINRGNRANIPISPEFSIQFSPVQVQFSRRQKIRFPGMRMQIGMEGEGDESTYDGSPNFPLSGQPRNPVSLSGRWLPIYMLMQKVSLENCLAAIPDPDARPATTGMRNSRRINR